MIQIGQLLQKASYASKLQTDEWRNYSYSIKRKRGGFCECCKRSGVEIHVHHICYSPDKKPWEHEDEDVIVLCKGCHSELHSELNKFRRYVFRELRPEHFRILNLALASGLTGNDPLEFVHAVAEMAKSPTSVTRFAYAWNDGKKPK